MLLNSDRPSSRDGGAVRCSGYERSRKAARREGTKRPQLATTANDNSRPAARGGRRPQRSSHALRMTKTIEHRARGPPSRRRFNSTGRCATRASRAVAHAPPVASPRALFVVHLALSGISPPSRYAGQPRCGRSAVRSPDRVRAVVHDQERTVGALGDAHRAAPDGAVGERSKGDADRGSLPSLARRHRLSDLSETTQHFSPANAAVGDESRASEPS